MTLPRLHDVNPNTLLGRVQKRWNKVKALREQHDFVRSLLFADVYAWHESALSHGICSTLGEGHALLASTLGIRAASASHWYYCGKFMRDNRLDAESVAAESVSRCAYVSSWCPKPTFRKIIAAIRDGQPSIAVGRMVTAAEQKTGRAGELRIAKLERKGQLTEAQVKRDLESLVLLVQRVYGEDHSLAVLGDNLDIVLEVPAR